MTAIKQISSSELLFEYLNSEDLAFYDTTTLPTEDELPYDDGVPMETQRHRDQMNILIDSLKYYWKDSRNYYVGGNMFLHFDPLNRQNFRGPDVFLVLDVDPRERKSWVVWQEGMRFPDLIIELLSISTHKIDRGIKKDLYAQVFKTGEYYLYDPFSQEFVGYRLSGSSYTLIEPDANRRIYSAATGLALVIHDDRLRWINESGLILPTGMELAEQASQRAEWERQRAEQESQRAEREKLRAEQESQRAEQAENRLLKTVRQMLERGFSHQEILALTGISPTGCMER